MTPHNWITLYGRRIQFKQIKIKNGIRQSNEKQAEIVNFVLLPQRKSTIVFYTR